MWSILEVMMHNRKIEGFLGGQLVVKIESGHLINCISLNKSLIVSETQFLHLKMEILILPAVLVGRQVLWGSVKPCIWSPSRAWGAGEIWMLSAKSPVLHLRLAEFELWLLRFLIGQCWARGVTFLFVSIHGDDNSTYSLVVLVIIILITISIQW